MVLYFKIVSAQNNILGLCLCVQKCTFRPCSSVYSYTFKKAMEVNGWGLMSIPIMGLLLALNSCNCHDNVIAKILDSIEVMCPQHYVRFVKLALRWTVHYWVI